MAPNGQQKVQALASELVELSKAYQPQDGPSGAGVELVTKAKELIAAVESPAENAFWKISSLAESCSIAALLSLNALQSIPADGSMTLSDLESASGAQAALLARLLRVVESSGFILRNNSDGTYSHTALSRAYASGPPGIIFSALFEQTGVMTSLPAYFRTRGAREPEGEKAMTHNPSTWYYGQEGKTVFEVMMQRPEEVKAFQEFMVITEPMRPYTGYYDFAQLATEDKDRPVLVDVGGGDGTAIARILEAHPEVKPEQCVLQDRAEVVELAKQNSALARGVHFQPHDFFQPQVTKHARGYSLRMICHDWSDMMCIKILSHIAAVMAPDSKVLIFDVVLPESPTGKMPAFMDLLMMSIGGKERSKTDLAKVLDAAGLKVKGVHYVPGDFGLALTEAVLK